MKVDRIASLVLITSVTGVKAASEADIDAMLPKWNPPRIEISLKTAPMECIVAPSFTVYPAKVHHVASAVPSSQKSVATDLYLQGSTKR